MSPCPRRSFTVLKIVLFPNFSQKYAEMEEPAYREYVIRILKNTLLVMLPVSLLFWSFWNPSDPGAV